MLLRPLFMAIYTLVASACPSYAGEPSQQNEDPCFRLIPSVKPGDLVFSDSAGGDRLVYLQPADASAYYLELLPFDRLDIGLVDRFSALQVVAEQHPGLSITVVVGDGNVARADALIDQISSAANLSRISLIRDTLDSFEHFGVPSRCFMSLLIDHDGRLRFWRCCGISVREVNLLADKFANHPEQTSDSTDNELFQAGRDLPNLPIYDITSKSVTCLPEAATGARRCFIFSAACTKCELDGFLRRMLRLTDIMGKEFATTSICLFSGIVDTGSITDLLRGQNAGLRSYTLIPEGEEKAAERGQQAQLSSMSVITWDSLGVIEDVRGFDSFVDSQIGGRRSAHADEDRNKEGNDD